MTTAEKEAKLQEMMLRMEWRDRERFREARRKYKANLDHDLFVASLHIPFAQSVPNPNRRAVQYRMGALGASENPAQLVLAENEEEERRGKL